MLISLVAQNTTTIKGIVIDAKTKEPLPYARIIFLGKTIGTASDAEGKFILESKGGTDKIQVSYLGYKTLIKPIIINQSQVITLKLCDESTQLDEVVITSDKKKYKKKGNPAVELIEKVINHKESNRREGLPFYEYEKYEKIQLAFSNISEKFQKQRILKDFQFVFDNIDSSKIEGVGILPIFIKESLSQVYYRNNPKATKEIIKGNKMVSIEGYLDNEGISTYFKFLYQDINIYDNNITILSNQFISPISGLANTFYKFYIMDTSIVEDVKCIRMSFYPRNTADMLFQGDIYIAMDSSYAIKKVDMRLNEHINLNWVNNMRITQTYDKKADHGWMLIKDDISIDFGYWKNKMGIYGQRSVSYKNIEVNKPQPDVLYEGPPVIVDPKSNKQTDTYWHENRHQELSSSESGTYKMIDSIKQVPAFKFDMDILFFLMSGYKRVGMFDIGPVGTFINFNPVEGFRPRLGGKTNPFFSKKYNFDGYLAYGFADTKLKYSLGTTLSLTPHSIYEFPVRSIRLAYNYDSSIPGQDLDFAQQDNLFLAFKRGINDKILYNRKINVEYLHECENHFSYTFGIKTLNQVPGGSVHFNTTNYLESGNEQTINTTELYTVLRYAPNEKFYQGPNYRSSFTTKNPVFTLGYNYGVKNVFNGEYEFHKLTASVSKRCFLSFIGYTDVYIEGGNIFGKLPYSLLAIHRANQTYSYQTSSYNLMNFLEFVSDRYVVLNIDHCFNGLFFNKIPLFKRLGLREVVTCKVLYGEVTKNNDPKYNTELFKFPVNSDGTPITYTLEKQPYIEGSIGIGNILKIFRIDIVRRFTYLDHPDVTKTGIRMLMKFDF